LVDRGRRAVTVSGHVGVRTGCGGARRRAGHGGPSTVVRAWWSGRTSVLAVLPKDRDAEGRRDEDPGRAEGVAHHMTAVVDAVRGVYGVGAEGGGALDRVPGRRVDGCGVNRCAAHASMMDFTRLPRIRPWVHPSAAGRQPLVPYGP